MLLRSLNTAMSLISEFWKGNNKIRAISISIFNLEDGQQPIALLDNINPKQQALENSVYNVKSRFGKRVISHGSILNNDLGV